MPTDPKDESGFFSADNSDTSPVLQIRPGGNLPARVGSPVLKVLVEGGLITPAQVKHAQSTTRRGEDVIKTLINSGVLGEDAYLELVSRTYQIPIVSLVGLDIDPNIIKYVPKTLAVRYSMVPIGVQERNLIIAVADLLQHDAIHQDIGFAHKLGVDFVLAKKADIRAALVRCYGEVRTGVDLREVFKDDDPLEVVPEEVEDTDANALAKASEEAPIIKMVRATLLKAIQRGASDIHVESFETFFCIRLRVDGVLYEEIRAPIKLRNAFISRIKIMSNLDISERRLPQDGRIRLKIRDDKIVDFRVSIIPTVCGENAVLRILDKSALSLDLALLGFEGNQFSMVQAALSSPWGMVLVTGPTGAGKTTTLYSALALLNKPDIKMLTVEDPVEMTIPGVVQVHVHSEINLTFAVALRAFLRQDPDVIMVGEIRDFETAEIAVQAALTGHLVLSTLHTNDAPASIDRLIMMGVERFMVASTVRLVCAQRLVRKICSTCRVQVNVDESFLQEIGFSVEESRNIKAFKGTGCELCDNTGYKGRTSCFEVLLMDENLRAAIIQGEPVSQLKLLAMQDGMITLRQAGLAKVAKGITTIDEVLRVTHAD